ncbi:MAG: NAD(P)H-hydrate dehydratase [Novosphingobium sp.]|nr:NAD(P)H-hydrate dehydratase [Novosphingobium sp.]
MPTPDATRQILTVAQMRAAEQALIDSGETVDSLMQKAGQGAAEWVWRIAGGRPVTVLCGPGNNGGDGYVIAETLRERGLPVAVVALCDPRTEAAGNARQLFKGEILAGDARPDGAIMVDCLFGSGLVRPLDAEAHALLCETAASHSQRIAIDLPSGIDADSARPLNPGLPSYDLTVALGAWKFAHWLMPAMAQVGVCRRVSVGVEGLDGAAKLITRPRLSAPERDAHKYRRGLLAVVAGQMPGAARLAALAAARGGAGYVKLLADGAFAADADLVTDTQPLDIALDDPRISAVLVGPGLGRSANGRARLRAVLARDCSTVLDADALVLLRPDMLEGRSAPVIATPHEGELERLGETFGIDQAGKLDMASALAAATGMTVVAKGPDTLVATPDGRVAIAPPAPSWLSTAGTGDVLAGLVASRLATGADSLDAARAALWLHGEAARIAGPAFTASELAAQVSQAFADCL